MNKRNIILFPVSLEAAKLFDEAMQQEAKRLGYTVINNEPEPIKITAREELPSKIFLNNTKPIDAILKKGRKRW